MAKISTACRYGLFLVIAVVCASASCRSGSDYGSLQSAASGCEPIFYVTLHTTKQVIAVSSNGTALVNPIADSTAYGDFSNLRGMWAATDAFYLLNAYASNSRVLKFGLPDGVTQRRPFIGVVADGTVAGSGLLHPYAISISSEPAMYLTPQDTEVILKLNMDGTPFNPSATGYPGQFASWTESAGGGSNGVRGIAVHNKLKMVFCAQEYYNEVFVYDFSGTQLTTISFVDPVGVTVDELATSGSTFPIYVGSGTGDYIRQILVTRTSSGVTVATGTKYKSSSLNHPASFVVYNGSLIVPSHNTNTLVRFDVESGTMLGVFATFADAPEAVIVGNSDPNPQLADCSDSVKKTHGTGYVHVRHCDSSDVADSS